MLFESLLNLIAELTYFADRGFYGDWWNSISWDQFARVSSTFAAINVVANALTLYSGLEQARSCLPSPSRLPLIDFVHASVKTRCYSHHLLFKRSSTRTRHVVSVQEAAGLPASSPDDSDPSGPVESHPVPERACDTWQFALLGWHIHGAESSL